MQGITPRLPLLSGSDGDSGRGARFQGESGSWIRVTSGGPSRMAVTRSAGSELAVSRARVFGMRAGLTAQLARRRDRYPRTDRRARADRALDLERAAERADAVGEPAQSRALRGVNTTAAVVAHLNHRVSFAHRNPHLDPTRVGVLSGVRECFNDD